MLQGFVFVSAAGRVRTALGSTSNPSEQEATFTRLRDNHGLTRVEFREQVHMIKRNEGLPADFDLTFGPTGDVWNPSTGDLIGSLIHGY